MAIYDTIWLIAHSSNPEDRRTWAVLYWKSQGMTHKEIATHLEYGYHWVQRYLTRTYRILGVTDWSKEEKETLLETQIYPAVRRVVEGDPELLKVLPVPEDEVVTGEAEEVKGDTQPVKTVVVSPTYPPTAPIVERKRFPRWIPVLIGLLVLAVVVRLGGGWVWDWYEGRPVPPKADTSAPIIKPSAVIPTVTLESTLVPNPTSTLVPTLFVPTETFAPPPDGILFQDSFDAGLKPEWRPLNGNWMTIKGQLTILYEDFDIKWIEIGTSDWHSYRVEADIDRSVGDVYIGLRGGSIFYKVSLHDCWTVENFINGSCIGDEAPAVSPVQHLIFEVSGDQFTAYSNGEKFENLSLANLPNGGVSIGILCQEGFPCPSLDNFKVTYLP